MKTEQNKMKRQNQEQPQSGGFELIFWLIGLIAGLYAIITAISV